MATSTKNLELIKPELADNITPTIFADNFDKIDDSFGKIKSVQATLNAASWTGSAAPFTINISVPGMTASWVPGAAVAVSSSSDTIDQIKDSKRALGCITAIQSSSAALKFICASDKPSTNVTVIIPGVM